MKNLLIGLGALTFAVGAPELGRVAAQEETVVEGLVVCKTCYLRDNSNLSQTMDYADLNEGEPDYCGTYCVWAGRPLAVLTEDNKLYTITGKVAEPGRVRIYTGKEESLPYPDLQKHFNHIVLLYGVVTEKNGELELAANKLVWTVNHKDWRVGSDLETKFGKDGGVYKDGKKIN